MPKRYPPDRKREALELLELHNHNVPIIHELTGIPSSTLYRWRRQEFSKNPDLMRQKNIAIIDNSSHKTESPSSSLDSTPQPSDEDEPVISQPSQELDDSNTPSSPWTPPKETPVGVPGKTYPYPLEEEEESQDNYEDFRKVRDILMDHAHQLAANLKPDDPDINRRSLALSRILDRVHQLDDMLPDLNPEKVLRFEYVYDGQVHNIAPWERTEGYLEDELKWVRERKAREARGDFKNGPITM